MGGKRILATLMIGLAGAAAAAEKSVPAKYKVLEAPRASEADGPGFRILHAQDSTTVTIYAGQRPTGGYSVEVAGVDRAGGTCTVRYRVKPPGRDAMVAQVLTYPAAAIRIAPPCRDVKLDPPLPASHTESGPARSVVRDID